MQHRLQFTRAVPAALPAQDGHCKRVAALSIEVSRGAGLPLWCDRVLQQAAELHHTGGISSAPTPLERLAWDMACDGAEVQTVLALFNSRRPARSPSVLHTLAGILRLCNLVDEQLESFEFEHRDIGEVLDEIAGLAELEHFDPALVEPLRRLHCGDPLQQVGSGDRLPAEARVAGRVFRALAPDREYEAGEIEALAATDPVLAAMLIRVANSALFSPGRTISTIRQAVTYIGTVAARKVLLASVLRPLFAGAGLTRLWSHAICAAQFGAAAAPAAGCFSAEEGMLLGLVHDFGALAVHFLSATTLAPYQRLVERGCPPAFVEQVLFGMDHGEIGAALLDQWGFPESLVEAVRYHHQPERTQSAGAAFAYLMEFWSGLDEDLPSFHRVQDCLARTGMTIESLTQVGDRDQALKALRSVA